MILMDLNQIMLATFMVQIGNHKNAEVDVGMIRHMVLNSIRHNKVKFTKDFGELIICADDKNYWRKSFFKYYKYRRKEDREASELDWNEIFKALNLVREELVEFFPYKAIRVQSAEADDIIGTIVHHEGRILGGKPILVLSGDKDYIQLQTYANVKQYNPTKKKFVTHPNPSEFLLDHIIRGDTSDGVPNILSPDNTFAEGLRQRTIGKKKYELLCMKKFTSEEQINWDRNETLIDLSKTPENIKAEIFRQYAEENTKDRSRLIPYFMEHKLRILMDKLEEF